MDFIEALTMSHNKSVIFRVVDRPNRTLQAREHVITMLKFHLKAALYKMKTYADKKRSEREFVVGDLESINKASGLWNGLEETWERYLEEVLQRFGPIVEDPMTDLKNLKQTSTIKVYQYEFDALLSKVDITDSQAVSMFLGGMNTDIATMGNNQQLQIEIQGSLEEFNDVFAISTCLPPNRSLDHRIPLKEGVNVVNIRPYRYAHA
nr:retrovirus-related Pol polyprotein from transposon 297 family [Tanacetum cinerariifolium]